MRDLDWKWISGVVFPIIVAAFLQYGTFTAVSARMDEKILNINSRLDQQSQRLMSVESRMTTLESLVGQVQLKSFQDSAEMQKEILDKINTQDEVRDQRSRVVDDRLADIAIGLAALTEKTNALADLVAARDRQLQNQPQGPAFQRQDFRFKPGSYERTR